MATDRDVTLSPDIVRVVLQGLDAAADLPLYRTPEQHGVMRGRADYARERLRLWLRDCQPEEEGTPT